MNAKFFSFLLRRGLLTFIAALVLVLPAHAGNIFFGLSLTDNKLTLTNQGNSTAFYPVVLRLLSDGHWEALAAAPENAPPAELLPGTQFNLIWPNTLPQQKPSPLELLRPIMVRFFDQAGNDFGQISFFNQAPMTADLSQTGYVHGLMTIKPPSGEGSNDIRTSWLLWPQEEGIAPLTAPLHFQHSQPPARHIEWRPGTDKLQLNLGAGLPSAILLHETSNGFAVQNLLGGGMQGLQQRSSWLDASELFYTLAELAAAGATILMLWHLVGAWRRRSNP